MRSQIELRGIKELARNPGLEEKVRYYTDQAYRRARRGARATYDTGLYERSIKMWRGRTASVVYFYGSDAYDAGFVEWGMGRLRARHNLLNAARKTGFKLRAVKYTH
jgi:hypothetical protein